MNKFERFTHFFLFFLTAVSLMAFAHAAPAFTPEAGVRLTSATPQSITGSYPNLRLYFLRTNAVRTATSTDGLIWNEEIGTRVSVNTLPSLEISSITAAAVQTLNDGGFRMLYSIMDSSDAFKIVSATSTDGIAWTNDTGVRLITGDGSTYVGSPRLLELSNGNWRMYYVQDTDGGNDLADRKIFTSLSSDEGLTWSTSTLVTTRNAQEIAVSTLTNQSVRLVHSFIPAGSSNAVDFRSVAAASSNGTFNAESGLRLSTTTGVVSFPLLIRSSETYRWRLYYAHGASATAVMSMFSALTLTPHPQSVSPAAVLRSNPTADLTISGEIFSPAPTVTVTRSGETDIPGTAVTRVDDQTITATIATLDKTSGAWSVAVTNDDANAGTLTNGLTVTFAAGNIVLINNVLRPRENVPVEIHIRINESGRVHVRLYTLEGRLIRTVVDEDLASGATVRNWDGRNDNGDIVSSGTYLLKASGPKLNEVQKIVVIR